jgi:hypothetical protein
VSEESEGSLKDFICDSDSNDSNAKQGKVLLKQMLGDRHYSESDYDSMEDSAEMEAGYDTLEEEDHRTQLIAEMEDENELQNIKEDRIHEKNFREGRLKQRETQKHV